ncbi:MAG: cobalamin B12-binding domain-containing protein [Acidobacteria bacterium]|nr:cobalamin B12-binding domain-containing protein [Acidobacteriota bacterium]
MNTTKSTKVTLIQHPTVAIKITGFTNPDFDYLAYSGIYLGNIYRRIIPASLARVASVMERELGFEVDILDLRVADCDREERYKVLDWEGYQVEVLKVGAPFSYADQAILESDIIGISSHFTYESGVVKDLIGYIKQLNPQVKVIVGGADVSARPHDYLAFGADLAFIGDFNPQELASGNWEPRMVGAYRHPFEALTKPAFHKLPHLMEYEDSHDGPVPEGVQTPIGFIYFTRGCPRECNFCESRKSVYEYLDLEVATAMLDHYQQAGIRTLNIVDDNLLLQAANKEGRKRLLELLQALRDRKFAWEFPNGLEVGRLSKNGVLDEELMEALFTHTVDSETGQIVGAYRLYLPVETFDRRADYSKLKPLNEQNGIIAWLASCGLPELDFGIVLPPDADHDLMEKTKNGYLEIRDIVNTFGSARARYSVFHLIPIATFRSMQTKYSVQELPEGWHFYFPVYDGLHFSARELFEERLRLIKEVDFENYQSMRRGQYAYA